MGTQGNLSGAVALAATLLVIPHSAMAQEAPAMTGSPTCANGRLLAESATCSGQEALPGPYIVFFPWGEMGVDGDGALIVNDAAASYQAGLTITLSGHSDRSGPEAVNRRISQRRAEAVRNALIDRGVPTDAISVEVAGESALLIGTPDGAREAQNRRVEILFSREEN